MKKTLSASTALHFVLVIGVVNLFADMTYEGARSSTGQFLGTLGASAAVVGFTVIPSLERGSTDHLVSGIRQSHRRRMAAQQRAARL